MRIGVKRVLGGTLLAYRVNEKGVLRELPDEPTAETVAI
jgi:hypothetical protein